MEFSILIANIILSMREFQEKNGIKNQCVVNAKYLYDCIKMNSNNANIKVKAVLATAMDEANDTTTFVGGHLILDLLDEDDETHIDIDPSYDIFSLKNISYFNNIKDLMDVFNNNDKNKIKTTIDLKQILSNHIYFMKVADQINNGKFIFLDKKFIKFYNDQADYIENLYSK
jgi:hypothetical protein